MVFAQKGTRISYQNALVLEDQGDLVGVAILYDGAKARELDAPLERAAAARSGNSNYSIPTEPETSGTLSLRSASLSIEAGCDWARELGHHRIALLVDVTNPAAKRLYERLGFRAIDTKWIAGAEYVHMTRSV